MEVKSTKYGKVIVMDFVTAEHCGMEMDKLQFESELSNVNVIKEEPIAIIIQFRGGFVITDKTKKETIDAMTKDTTKFHKFIKALPQHTK